MVDATVKQPDLVPSDSLEDRAAHNLYSEEPWMVWNASPPPPLQAELLESAAVGRGIRAESDLEAAVRAYAFEVPSRAKRFDSPFAAVRRMRAASDAVSGLSELNSEPVSPAQPPPAPELPQFDEGKIEMLVQTLRIPRSSVEKMLGKIEI